VTWLFVESGLEFTFTGAVDVEKLDGQERGAPHPPGKVVDFVVEEAARMLLIEVKNPSASGVDKDPRPSERRTTERTKRRGNELINAELVPKARGSYTYLHLMARDTKPFMFVLVDDVSALGPELADLEPFRERLAERLRHESGVRDAWKREYVASCVVVTPETWPSAFPSYSLRRLSEGQVAPDNSDAT